MTRLSQILFAATAIAAVPLTAFAEDPVTDPPADPNAGGGGDGTAVPPVEGGGAAVAPGWSKSVIDRPLTVLKSKLGAFADLYILHVTPPTILGMAAGDSVTSEGLAVGAEYGISDKLAVGGSYAFALNEFEIKGTLTAFGAFAIMHSDKLDLGASADIALDLGRKDAMGDSSIGATIHAGLGVRYKVASKFAVFTGMPWAPGPLGQHLTLGLNEGAAKTFSLPVGFGMQATPELFAFLNTNLFSITLSEVADGVSRFNSIADATPLTLGAFYSVNKNIDAAVSFGFPDLQNAGDAFLITVGARYYN